MWFLTQMIRWGQLRRAVDLQAVAEEVYRPDVYREAAAVLGLSCPGVDYKTEGRHDDAWKLYEGTGSLPMGADRFLDGRRFDPSHPVEYLQGFDVRHPDIDWAWLAAINHPGGVRREAY
jgi:nitrate/nitrite transport system substrate-binding protein